MVKLPLLISFFMFCSYSHLTSQTAIQNFPQEPLHVVQSEIVADTGEKITKIRTIVKEQVANNHFTGNVLIAEKGEVIYQESFGLRDRANGLLHQKGTRFSIASITKMITAIVILQLVEEEKLNLESTLAELLPEFDIPKQNKISIHHLLLHISGLPNEPSDIYLTPTNPAEYVQRLMNGFRKNKGFGKFNYANIDYVLLGLIIEKVTGQSWEQAVLERVINPLGLQQTGFLAKDTYPKNFAQTYTLDGAVFIKDPEFFIENFYAAACMYSTAEDLLKIDRAMYGTVLLSEKSKALMFTSYPKYNYTGYSVWSYQYPFVDSNPRIMERRGGIMGANVVLIRMLDTETSIIILSNNNAFDPDSFGDLSNFREALIIALAE